MHEKPLYVFSGCRLNINGREVILIYTPFSHIPESQRLLIENILTRLRQKQPVILVYLKHDQTTLSVVEPREWKQEIESRALPGSCFHPGSVLKELPIYEQDLPPASA